MFLGLQSFTDLVQGRTVAMFSGFASALVYLRYQGGMKYYSQPDDRMYSQVGGENAGSCSSSVC